VGIFETLEERGHEQLIFCHHQKTGLRALIAIHNTTLGPALGGCRLRRYADEDTAVEDVLRLSQLMTYQTAVAYDQSGGGMAVLWDEEAEADEVALRAFGRFIDGLRGRITVYSDLGTNDDDMRVVGRETDFVFANSPHVVNSETAAAWGVYHGITACLNYRHNDPSVRDRVVAIQGVGSVGSALADILIENGAKLIISDRKFDPLKAVQDSHHEVEVVKPEDIYDVPCEVFSPCAVGGTINAETVKRLNCKIIAGAAFDQLGELSLADELAERDILYAPDFVINAGDTLMHNNPGGRDTVEEVRKATEQVYRNLGRVFSLARRKKLTPYAAAVKIAGEKIKRIALTKSILVSR